MTTGQPARRRSPGWSGRHAARVVPLVRGAKFPYTLVVTLGEHRPPGLAHPRDHGDRRPGKTAPRQLLAGAVLQQAEQPELLTPGPGQADPVPAATRAVHGLPLAPTGAPRRR